MSYFASLRIKEIQTLLLQGYSISKTSTLMPTPEFLPGESQGQGSLMGCRLWGRTESDTTEATWQQQQHPTKMIYCVLGIVLSSLCELPQPA